MKQARYMSIQCENFKIFRIKCPCVWMPMESLRPLVASIKLAVPPYCHRRYGGWVQCCHTSPERSVYVLCRSISVLCRFPFCSALAPYWFHIGSLAVLHIHIGSMLVQCQFRISISLLHRFCTSASAAYPFCIGYAAVLYISIGFISVSNRCQ